MANEVSAVASAIAAGQPVRSAALVERLAKQAEARPRLEPSPPGFRASLEWTYPSVAVELAHRLVEELGALDPRRLRECARPECSLVFYDTTRPGTQRWHSEDPYGRSERQRRRRAHSQPTAPR